MGFWLLTATDLKDWDGMFSSVGWDGVCEMPAPVGWGRMCEMPVPVGYGVICEMLAPIGWGRMCEMLDSMCWCGTVGQWLASVFFGLI